MIQSHCVFGCGMTRKTLKLWKKRDPSWRTLHDLGAKQVESGKTYNRKKGKSDLVKNNEWGSPTTDME